MTFHEAPQDAHTNSVYACLFMASAGPAKHYPSRITTLRMIEMIIEGDTYGGMSAVTRMVEMVKAQRVVFCMKRHNSVASHDWLG